MSEDFFRYDQLVQNALRGVVRDILTKVVTDGLPGDHHFYIAFRTKAPGVKISARFHEKYPDEMTIVVQHQFWDLNVSEENFEIGLSFNNIPEKLIVPFSSLTGFMDPSTQFGLQFEHPAANDESEGVQKDVSKGGSTVPSIGARSKPDTDDVKSKTGKKASKARAKAENKAKAKAKAEKKVDTQNEPGDTSQSTGEIVQLDAFRKKS